MNNKTIMEFGFSIIWRIMEISEGVIRIFIILHKDTQPYLLIVN